MPGDKAQLAPETRKGRVERGLDRSPERNVLHASAPLADEVMVVLGEVLGELEMRVVGAVHKTPYHAGLLEHGKVAVGGALRKGCVARKKFREGHRRTSARQHLDDPATSVGVALLTTAEAVVDGPVQFGIPRR